MITPGEIARGQWIMIYDRKKSSEEENMPWKDSDPFMMGYASYILAQNSANIIQENSFPHLVLSVQLPFIAVADCTKDRCLSKIWRADEFTFVEVSDDFVKSLDMMMWHRGQKILNPNYSIPIPNTGYNKYYYWSISDPIILEQLKKIIGGAAPASNTTQYLDELNKQMNASNLANPFDTVSPDMLKDKKSKKKSKPKLFYLRPSSDKKKKSNSSSKKEKNNSSNSSESNENAS